MRVKERLATETTNEKYLNVDTDLPLHETSEALSHAVLGLTEGIFWQPQESMTTHNSA